MSTMAKQMDYSLYANAFGFLRQPLNFDPVNSDADIIITGVPFDLATTGRSGSRFGPEAIRRASNNLTWETVRWPWNFSLAKHLSIEDCG
ncbi:MAG: arginase family protein, partial [Endozoicomonas sp.]